MPTQNPIQQLNVGEALGGASGAGVMQTDANGVLLDPAKVALSSLANIATARILGRDSAGTGAVEELTAARAVELIESALEANALDWTVLQSFLAGLRLTPGAALSNPAEGTMWYESTGGRLMFRDPTGSIPLMEAGTWTPSFIADTPGTANYVYSTQVGTYIKMGRRLWIDLNLVTTTFDLTGASGTMRIQGLPYTLSTLSSQVASFPLQTMAGLSLATTAGLQMPMLSGGANSSRLLFRRFVAAANSTTGSLAVGSTNGFLSGQNVTLQGSGYIGRTNEA